MPRKDQETAGVRVVRAREKLRELVIGLAMRQEGGRMPVTGRCCPTQTQLDPHIWSVETLKRSGLGSQIRRQKDWVYSHI